MKNFNIFFIVYLLCYLEVNPIVAITIKQLKNMEIQNESQEHSRSKRGLPIAAIVIGVVTSIAAGVATHQINKAIDRGRRDVTKQENKLRAENQWETLLQFAENLQNITTEEFLCKNNLCNNFNDTRSYLALCTEDGCKPLDGANIINE